MIIITAPTDIGRAINKGKAEVFDFGNDDDGAPPRENKLGSMLVTVEWKVSKVPVTKFHSRCDRCCGDGRTWRNDLC